MKSSSAKYWILLAGCLVAVYGSFVAARHLRDEQRVIVGPAMHLEPSETPVKSAGPPLTSFAMTDQDGKPFDSTSLRGKVWVASFFFVNCPGTCWRLNQALEALQSTEVGKQALFVSITCDPENDTPEALKKYAEHFHADPARWTFLTGDLSLVKRIGRDMFQISVEKAAHTDRACVIDRTGQVRGRFRLTDPQQLELLKKLLEVVEAEPPAPAQATGVEHAADPPIANIEPSVATDNAIEASPAP